MLANTAHASPAIHHWCAFLALLSFISSIKFSSLQLHLIISDPISALNHSGLPNQKHMSTPMSTAKYDSVATNLPVNGPPSWDSHITAAYVNRLRDEVCHLRQLLVMHEAENASKMPMYESEERSAIEENRRLRKMLQIEKERREALSRQLSESESSLEMEDER